jgi:methyl-accepting chemotaxis protein
MEELQSTVRQNADNATQASRLATSTSTTATSTGESMGRVVSVMQDIKASSGKISEIIGIIDGIAFQTNILALNAAVEAARAGDVGRGFAVVATEVRSLAQRSASAAREIKTLIDESSTRIEAGAGLVDTAGRSVTEVMQSIRQVTEVINSISNATREQSSGIDQVNTAVVHIDETTQQNAALVEEAAAAAKSLEDQVSQLVRAASVFTVRRASGGNKVPAGIRQLAAASA